MPSDSRETTRLLELAAAGNGEAFDRLFDAHRKSLKKLVSLRLDTRLRGRLDASDVVQETQMVAFRRFRDYLQRRPMPFQLWLRKTALQQVCDAQRTHLDRRRRSVLREDAGPSSSSRLIARNLLSDQPSALTELARRELQRRVASAVAELSDTDREIVVMRNVEGLSFDEIAPVLDMQPAAVRQRYGRALLKLRSRLKDQNPGDSSL